MDISKFVLAEACANPARVMGCFNDKFQRVWKTEMSAREGDLCLSGSTWLEATNPWWVFLTDVLLVVVFSLHASS